MPYSNNVIENNYVLTKRKPRQQKQWYVYSDYSEIEDSEEKIKSQPKKNTKKKRKKATLKNLKQV